MLKRLLLTALLAAGMASQATATTYYLNSRGGNDGAAGESTTPWRTLAHANATVSTGDVVMVLAGTYYGNINPACQSEATDWVTFIGALDDPASIKISGGAISKPYVSVKGVSFVSAAGIATNLTLTSNRDSIQHCIVSGSLEWGASDYCFIGDNHINGTRFGNEACEPRSTCPYECTGTDSVASAVVFNSNHFTNLFSRTTTGAESDLVFVGADSCSFLFNTFDINAPAGVGAPSAYLLIKHSSYLEFYGNRWNFNSVGINSSGCAPLREIRDRVTNTTFKCDTVISRSEVNGHLGLMGNGVKYGTSDDVGCTVLTPTTYSIVYDSSYVYMANSGLGLNADAQMNKVTITNNVIINNGGPAFTSTGGVVGRNLINHNTFVGRPNQEHPGTFLISGPIGWSDTTLVTNNIFYAMGQEFPESYIENRAAVQYRLGEFDSTFYDNESTHDNHLISDHNLYSYYGPSAFPAGSVADTVGKKSIGLWDNTRRIFAWPGRSSSLRAAESIKDTLTIEPGVFADTVLVHIHPILADTSFKIAVTRTVKTAPTSGSVVVTSTATAGLFLPNTLWSGQWCPGCDDSSSYGSPAFADSSAETFNSAITKGSLAIGAGSAGSDIGAIAYVDPPDMEIGPPGEFRIHIESLAADSATLAITNLSEASDLELTAITVAVPSEGYGACSIDETLTIAEEGTESLVLTFNPSWTKLAPTLFGYITANTNDPMRPKISIPVAITYGAREHLED